MLRLSDTAKQDYQKGFVALSGAPVTLHITDGFKLAAAANTAPAPQLVIPELDHE